MKAKKDKVVKYAGGGAAAAAATAGTAAATGGMAAIGGAIQLGLGAAQTAYGLYSAQKAKREFQRAMAAAPSLETPGQFYENYRNAYDAEIARMETDAIQSNLATSVQALQGAGGRALVGGLSSAARTAQDAQNRMLAQERAMRMQAGQQLAVAEEREIGRKEARSVRQQQYANQAYQAAMGNIGAGIASAAEGAMYTDFSKLKPKKKEDGEGLLSKAKDGLKDVTTKQKEPTPAPIKPVFETPSQFEALAPVQGSAIPKNVRDEQILDEEMARIQKLTDMASLYKGLKYFQSGGMMTQGAFNHNTNPIDLVQNGQKVGEATGGEFIVNPSQAAAIAKESSYARKLFKRFEKNAKKKK